MKKLLIGFFTAMFLIGCSSASRQAQTDQGGATSNRIFDRYEKVYECSERFATDRFLYMNNDGDTAKVRFFGKNYIGVYEAKDLQRNFWFGSIENQEAFRYLVVLETDGYAFLYDFSKTTSPEEEVGPARELSCHWGSFLG